jgi:hypothetical protein
VGKGGIFAERDFNASAAFAHPTGLPAVRQRRICDASLLRHRISPRKIQTLQTPGDIENAGTPVAPFKANCFKERALCAP